MYSGTVFIETRRSETESIILKEGGSTHQQTAEQLSHA